MAASGTPSDQHVLRGIRVVDWTRGAALRATSLLADYGADVIWIEEPPGDATPALDPVARAVFGRNKRSVSVDLTTTGGRQQMAALLSAADVFVVEQGPGAPQRLGFDYETLHEATPSLVYCSLSAFGPTSAAELRTLPPYEALVHAQVGTMGEQVGYRESPIYEGLPFAGLGMAYLAQIGILAALYRRTQDGLGRCVETSLLDGALSFLSMLWGHADSDDVAAPMAPGAQRLVSRTFVCGDDEYLGVHTGASGAFGRLMAELGLSEQFPPSASGADIGVALTDEQRRIVEVDVPEAFLREDRAVWLERLGKADICAIPALRPTEVFDEPQVRHNAMVVKVDDPILGLIEEVAAPMRFGAGDALLPAATPAPRPGSTGAADAAADRPARVPIPVPAPGRGSATAPARRSPHRDRPMLQGLKVLDFGVWYASAYSSRMLADLGADVIKVEPLPGDQMRGMRRPFQSAHSRKRSFVADLKHPAMADVMPRLMAWADVIHHNMRPGAAERLGVGYEQAALANPEIVYLHAPGWGTSGPETGRQSFAPLVSGYVGAAYEVAGQFNPPTYPVGNEDPGAGMLGAIAVLMALVRGGGAYIELPQVNAAMNQVAHIARGAGGRPLGANALDPMQLRVSPTDGLYRTADSWVCVVAASPGQRQALLEATGLAAAAPDDDALAAALEAAFAGSTTGEWLERLAGAGVPSVEPLTTNNNRAFHLDPENHLTRRVAEVDGGSRRQIDTLIRIADVDIPPYRSAPGLGEHTAEILGEVGFRPDEIDALEQDKAVVVARG